MKRLLVAALLCALPLVAQGKPRVVATLPDLGAMAREIGDDKVDVAVIGKPSEDPHFVQAKPSYVVVLNRADLLIEQGLSLEVGWLPALLDQTRNPRIHVGAPGRVVAAQGVPLLDLPTAPVTRAMGDVHPGGNPHFTIDPERGKIVARNIAEGLGLVAPQFADEFRSNLEAFERRIDAALAECESAMAPHRGLKVVTYHRSMTYLADRFGLDVIGTIEPKPGIPPSGAHVAALIEQMKREGAKLILMEQWHERRIPDLLAQKTGARVVELPVQVGGAADVPDYPSLCRGVVTRITAALETVGD